MTIYQVIMLALTTTGTLALPAIAWIWHLQRRLLTLEIEHRASQTDIGDMKIALNQLTATLTSLDKRLAELTAYLRANNIINGGA